MSASALPGCPGNKIQLFLIYILIKINYIINIANNHLTKRKKRYGPKSTNANPNAEIINKLNEEHAELLGKMARLSATITDPAKVAKIGPVQTALLEGQSKAMQAYDEILLARIRPLK